jgi:gluconate 5-dehydrogenase
MFPDMFSLKGRTALITGSSRGLGRAMAEGLASAGAVVVLNGTDRSRLSSAAAEMRASGYSVYEWRKVLEANLTSAFVIGREAAIRMIPRGHGKIINIGSLTSELARATVAPYTVAKGGIKMLTRAMTAEWAAHGIQANAIGPGYMLTDMNQALVDNPTFDAWVKGRTPARRWGKPEELIGAAVFLASPASGYVNGQIIYIDGGMLSVL